MTIPTQKTNLFLQYADKVSSHKHISLFMLLLSVLYTILFCNISYITDSYEYGVVASCWIDSILSVWIALKSTIFFDSHYLLFSLYCPILFRPLHRYRFWAWASSSILLWMLWYGGTKIFSNQLGFWLWLGFAVSPFFRNLNTFADARVIVLPLFFG